MTDTSKPELVETAMAAVCDCIAIEHPDADNASDGETLMLFHGIGPTGTGGHITLNVKEIVEAVLSVTGSDELSSAKAEIERLRRALDYIGSNAIEAHDGHGLRTTRDMVWAIVSQCTAALHGRDVGGSDG